MPDNQQHVESSVYVSERRLNTRLPVWPHAFIELGENNGGIILNISEGGLTLTAASILTGDDLLHMRFQLPESEDWIETSGEIAWISESKRETGIRFLNLSEHSRIQTRNWISRKASRAELKEKESAVCEPIPHGIVAERTELNSVLSDPSSFLRQTKSTRTKSAPQTGLAVSESQQQTESPLRIPERRLRPRRRVTSLEYIDLGDNNGGIILNLSEGGMYVQAVANLPGGHVPHMSFRLPQSRDRIETSGQIIWTGESKKDAGIQFIHLSEEVRLKIRQWVKSEESLPQEANEVETESDAVRRKHERPLEMPRTRGLQTAASASLVSDKVARSHAQVPPPSPITASTLFGVKRTDEGGLVADEPRRDDGMNAVVVQRPSLAGIASIIVLVALISFLAGWIAAGPSGRKILLGMSGKQPKAATEPSRSAEPAPLPASSAANVHSVPVPNALPPEHAGTPSPARTAASVSSAPADSARPLENRVQTLPSTAAGSPKLPSDNAASTSTNVPSSSAGKKSQQVGSVEPPPASAANIASASVAIPAANVLSTPPVAPIAVREEKAPSPVPLNPPPAPDIVTGLVSVSASPFPSIRVPPELKAQISRQGASLQIGQLISRVEPIYPEFAERERIEGTVKFHVIIGRDGTIQGIEQASGSPSLLAAATSAVRQWRYKPASLGGQPVEAGEDITVVFRLQVTHAQ